MGRRASPAVYDLRMQEERRLARGRAGLAQVMAPLALALVESNREVLARSLWAAHIEQNLFPICGRSGSLHPDRWVHGRVHWEVKLGNGFELGGVFYAPIPPNTGFGMTYFNTWPETIQFDLRAVAHQLRGAARLIKALSRGERVARVRGWQPSMLFNLFTADDPVSLPPVVNALVTTLDVQAARAAFESFRDIGAGMQLDADRRVEIALPGCTRPGWEHLPLSGVTVNLTVPGCNDDPVPFVRALASLYE